MEEIIPESPQENKLPPSPTYSMTLGEFVREVFYFALKPRLVEAMPFGGLTLAKTLFYALLLDFGLMIAALILVGLTVGPSVDEQHQFKELLERLSPLMLFLTVAVAAPLVEEGIFRLFLRFHTLTLFASLLGAALFFIPRTSGVFLWVLSGFFVFVFLGLVGLYTQPEQAIKTLNKFWSQYFWILFYLSVFLFGFAHLSNYSLPAWKLALLAPILVLPQTLLGFILGYLRVRFGFLYAVLLHMIHNALLIIPVIIFKDAII